jgi:hypothetical protein
VKPRHDAYTVWSSTGYLVATDTATHHPRAPDETHSRAFRRFALLSKSSPRNVLMALALRECPRTSLVSEPLTMCSPSHLKSGSFIKRTSGSVPNGSFERSSWTIVAEAVFGR